MPSHQLSALSHPVSGAFHSPLEAVGRQHIQTAKTNSPRAWAEREIVRQKPRKNPIPTRGTNPFSVLSSLSVSAIQATSGCATIC